MAHFRDSVPSSHPGVVEAEPLGEGPAELGSRYRVVTEFAGRRNDLVYEIVELDRPSRVRLVAEAPSFTSDDTIEVAQRGGKVSVTYDADLRIRGCSSSPSRSRD